MATHAITLDADFFASTGYALETGLLALLNQCKGTDTQLIIADAVYQSVRAEMCRNVSDDMSEIANDIRWAIDKKSLPADLANRWSAITLPTPEEVVDARLEAFKAATGALVVPSTGVDAQSLVSGYFNTQPPFGHRADRTKEFLNAIALQSLQAWAEKNDAQIWAVSEDIGWINFAADNPRIEVFYDLPVLLAMLQPHEAVAAIQPLKKSLITALENATGDLYDQFVDSFEQAIGEVNPFIDYHSDIFSIGHPDKRLSLTELPAQNGIVCDIVGITDTQLSLHVMLTANVFAEMTLPLSTENTIDGEYIHLGSHDFSHDVEEMTFGLIVTLDRKAQTLISTEIIVTDIIDLGDINTLPEFE